MGLLVHSCLQMMTGKRAAAWDRSSSPVSRWWQVRGRHSQNQNLPYSIARRLYKIISQNQCFGSGSAWIRITLKDGIRIRIHIRVISWIRIRINLQMTSQNVWKKSLFEHWFKALSLYLEARFGSRTASKWKVGSRSVSASKCDKQDPVNYLC